MNADTNPTVDLPTSEEEAYHELCSIFGAMKWREFGDADRVMAILEAHPSLACRTFSACYNHGVVPLCCVLMCSKITDLEVIQKVYRLYPEAVLRLQGVQQDTALHFACRYYCSDCIVEFIFSQNPLALSTRNQRGQSPMDYLLASLRTLPDSPAIVPLKLLIGLCPGVVTEKNARGHDLLQAAMHAGCSTDALKVIADQYPSNQNDFIVGVGTEMYVGQARVLVNLLPQLRRLDCHAAIWTHETVEILLEGLLQNRSIVQLDGLSLPSSIMRNCQKARNLLGLLFGTNSTLQNIKLGLVRGGTDEKGDDAAVLDKIFNGLSSNHSLQKLELQGFRFPSWKSLAVSKPMTDTAVTELVLTACSMPVDSLSDIPTLFPTVSTLKLTAVRPLGGRILQRVDLTRSIVQILERGQNLESLTIASCCSAKINTEPIWEALRRNHVLKHYTVMKSLDNERKRASFLSLLEETNSTLEEVGEICFEPKQRNGSMPYGKMQYLLDLNKCGRKLARDDETSLDSFVQLLCKPSLALNRQLMENDVLGLLYGLLRESPTLWAL